MEALAGLERQLLVAQKAAAARERVVEATRTALTRLEQRANVLERALHDANAGARTAGRDRNVPAASEPITTVENPVAVGDQQPADAAQVAKRPGRAT